MTSSVTFVFIYSPFLLKQSEALFGPILYLVMVPGITDDVVRARRETGRHLFT